LEVIVSEKASRRFVMIMVDADDPTDAAKTLRHLADKIQTGETFESPSLQSRAMVRAHDGSGAGEWMFSGRYIGVGYDGEDLRPPAALFFRECDADAYANGGVWENEEDRPGDHGVTERVDVCGLAWNSFDPDPVPPEASGASTRY
jgi:hypothetical protein